MSPLLPLCFPTEFKRKAPRLPVGQGDGGVDALNKRGDDPVSVGMIAVELACHVAAELQRTLRTGRSDRLMGTPSG